MVQGQISFLKILSTFFVVSVLSLVAISTTGKLRLPHIRNGRMYLRDQKLTKASDTERLNLFINSLRILLRYDLDISMHMYEVSIIVDIVALVYVSVYAVFLHTFKSYLVFHA